MLLVTTAILCMSAYPATAFAYDVPTTVHIGLTTIGSNMTSVSISNQSITVGAEENGVYVDGGTLQSDSGFTMTVGGGTYGTISQIYTSYEMAKDNADAVENAIPAYVGAGQWRVYIKGLNGKQITEKTGLPAEDVASTANMILIQSNGKTIALTNGITPQFGAADQYGIITIAGKQYRGKIQCTRVNSGNIMPVNAISMEEYLYGVVPAEMPPSYAAEALKAQAVAARTYTITKMKAHAENGYELCDAVHCQAYKGKEAEQPATNSAVDATKGKVIYYNGSPIEAVFFASSGGYTENSQDIWTAPVEYLKAVPDTYEVDTNKWTKEFTAEQLTNLTASKGDNIGQVTDMVISKVSLGGRVQELKLVGTSGTKVLTKDAIRTYFSSLGGSLPSKMFTINGKGGGADTVVMIDKIQVKKSDTLQDNGNLAQTAVNNGNTIAQGGQYIVENLSAQPVEQEAVTVVGASNDTISTKNGTGLFVIEGKGNGHGVGMSQKGAQGMALQGGDFESILKHYYTGVTIE